MDFEHVSSAQASAAGQYPLSAHNIEELLLANMFDGERGGLVTMSVDTLVKEVAEIITEHYEQA